MSPLPLQAQTFRLMDLFAELQNMVYEMVLPSEVIVGPRPTHTENAQYLAILQACCQLHVEACAVLFGTSIFSIKLGECACYPCSIKWIHGIGEANASI